MPHTLTAAVRHEAEIRKSRFLALAAPIDAPEAAQAFLEASRDPQATHNCWAWRFGAHYRFHDDGEPGGTAGRPILQAIDSQGYDRVAVLVIRWFGGIKLGTGGLARAYGGTAAECLRVAERVELREECRVLCDCPYADMDRVQARLLAAGARIEQAEFDGRGVRWRLAVARADAAALRALYTDLTRGQGHFEAVTEPGPGSAPAD
ncbi:YigZ family protein [Castellaniella defragrans]|uniref:IMPACT family protein n=1 Tax=Castellaniella defragrans TaxID=75697 RepID=UPI002AFE955E|nr:YigZ family protein [Castellaniella defragrans]